jgi:hypothetical protein
MRQTESLLAVHFAIALRVAFAALGAALLPSCVVVGAVVLAPFELAASGPAPTLDAPEDPKLAERASGTLVIANGTGTITLIDLPSFAERQLEIGGTVIAATAPDEAGRVAYLREEWPLPQAILAFCFGVGKKTTILAVRSVDGGEERILAEVQSNRPGRSIELSPRGGRVLHFDTERRFDVFDIESGARLPVQALHSPLETPRLHREGDRLVYSRDASVNAGSDPIDRRIVTWEINLASGEERELHEDVRVPADTLDEIESLQLNYEHFPEADWPRGRIGSSVLVVAPNVAIYEGLPSPQAGARTYLSFTNPDFERSIRLGEREGSATMTLFPRFKLGTFAFTPRRFVR